MKKSILIVLIALFSASFGDEASQENCMPYCKLQWRNCMLKEHRTQKLCELQFDYCKRRCEGK